MNSTKVNEISAELNNGDLTEAVISITAGTSELNPVEAENEMMTVIQDEKHTEAKNRNAD